MPYICVKCKNKTSFLRECFGTYDELLEFDENDEFVDREGDIDFQQTGTDHLTCKECDSHFIEDVSDDEWDAWEGPIPNHIDWKERLFLKKLIR